jgi:acetolactate synthase I/II/III large subunit
MAREKADVTIVILKNDNYTILEIELGRVRQGEANDKMTSMIYLNNPTLDWVKIAEGQGVPASRATTADEFHKLFEAAMVTKGPRLIEAQIVEDIQPMVDYIRKSTNS